MQKGKEREEKEIFHILNENKANYHIFHSYGKWYSSPVESMCEKWDLA